MYMRKSRVSYHILSKTLTKKNSRMLWTNRIHYSRIWANKRCVLLNQLDPRHAFRMQMNQTCINIRINISIYTLRNSFQYHNFSISVFFNLAIVLYIICSSIISYFITLTSFCLCFLFIYLFFSLMTLSSSKKHNFLCIIYSLVY